jgi:hypothetical protein
MDASQRLNHVSTDNELNKRIGLEGRDWVNQSPKKTMDADLPQDRRPCLYLSSPMEN